MEQNGITFNSVKTAGIEKEAWPLILSGQQGPDEEGGIINAVDIDWNEANVSTGFLSVHSKTIQTTGDLLYWLQEDLRAASRQVSTLKGQVTDLQSTNAALNERIVKLETLVSGLYSALADDTSNN